MTNTKPDLDDHGFYIPSSSSLSLYTKPSLNSCYVVQRTDQTPRKKRKRVVKVDDTDMETPRGSNKKPPKHGKKSEPSALKTPVQCSECGKEFSSEKALFGHMRLHPERQWRGINPPPNFRRPTGTANAGSVGVANVDLQAKKPIWSISVEEVNDGNEDEHEVAAILLMLANGEGGEALPQHHFKAGNTEGSPSRFECLSCKRVFPSHQALGGHRASHKNVKGCFAITQCGLDGEAFADDYPSGSSGSVYGEAKESLEGGEYKMVAMASQAMVSPWHLCDICLKVFPTGQALGGHKRSHWEREDQTPLIETQMGSSSITEAEASPVGFDLNLPPVEEEDLGNLDLRLNL